MMLSWTTWKNNTYVFRFSSLKILADHIMLPGVKLKRSGQQNGLKTIGVNKVTNRWRNHNNKTTKISELNKIIELYEL